jgi:hypothetical protein
MLTRVTIYTGLALAPTWRLLNVLIEKFANIHQNKETRLKHL